MEEEKKQEDLNKETEEVEITENIEENTKPKKTLFKEIMEWVYCIIVAVILAIVFRYYIGTPTIVQQKSMFPTLIENQRLWLNRWGRTTKTLPERGEIITFEAPSKTRYTLSEIDENNPIARFHEKKGFDWFIYNFLEIGKKSYIKRVIGLPGEHIEIKDGGVYINGEKLEENYLQEGVVTDILNPEGAGYDDFIVPENCVFAMGDNRNESTDCREFGCVPLEKIESTVALRIWPLDVFGKVE